MELVVDVMDTNKKENKVVDINTQNGTERIQVDENDCVLILNGQVIELEAFILSGEDKEENQVVFIHNASNHEAIVYEKYVSTTIQQNLLRNMDK